MTSFTDPDYQDHVVTRVLLMPLYADLQLRETVEAAFCSAFASKTSVEVIPSLTLLPPTREVSGQELAQLLRDREIDSTLVLEQTGTDSSLEGAGHLSGRSFNFSAKAVTSEIRHSLRLFDVAADRTVWIASAHTRQTAEMTGTIRIRAGFSTFMNSLAKETVGRLLAEGHVRPR